MHYANKGQWKSLKFELKYDKNSIAKHPFNFPISRLLLSLLLLLSPLRISPALPFYCRRMKGYCSIRRESICCSEETNTNTSEENTDVEESKDIQNSDLLASSSIIKEVDRIKPPVSGYSVYSNFNLICVSVPAQLHPIYPTSNQTSPTVLQVAKV